MENFSVIDFLIVAFKFNSTGCDRIWRDVAKLGAKSGVVPVSNRLWIKPFWEGETKHALIPGWMCIVIMRHLRDSVQMANGWQVGIGWWEMITHFYIGPDVVKWKSSGSCRSFKSFKFRSTLWGFMYLLYINLRLCTLAYNWIVLMAHIAIYANKWPRWCD